MDDIDDVPKVFRAIYAAYGTDSRFLFGIPPQFRDGVKMVVKAVLEYQKGEEKTEGETDE